MNTGDYVTIGAITGTVEKMSIRSKHDADQDVDGFFSGALSEPLPGIEKPPGVQQLVLILFFSAVGWTLLASLIENRLASDIHGRPMPSARARTLLTLFRNALAVVISTITIMILLSEIGVNIASGSTFFRRCR